MPLRNVLPIRLLCMLSFLGLALSLSACGGDEGGSLTPVDPSGTGSLTVAASTAGSEVDPNGYTFTVDGAERGALDGSSGVTTSGLTPGDHSVGLNGVAANCEVQGDNPRMVTISSGETALVTFNVVCDTPAADAGSIRITASTSGTDPDPDGYLIILDGIEPGIAVPVTGSALFPSVVAGSHSLTLSGVAANCSVVGGAATITINVSSGATTEVSFAVDCGGVAPSVGVLRVTTTTTGPDQDGDGYRFAVDGGATQRIGLNAGTDLVNTLAGVHSVVLSDVAGNCSVDQASKSVTITAGATATVAFTITCTLRPPTVGSIRVTTSTSGPDQDPNGYQFSIDGGQDRAIGVDGSETVNNLAPGEYTVRLSGVAENCSIADVSKDVTVTSGETATVAFEITCTALPPSAGSIRITTSTTGPNQDTDGYRFVIDGGSGRSIEVSGTETVADVPAGSHTVVLSDVAANCSVDDASKNVTVTGGQTSEVTFTITCRSAGPSATQSTMLAAPKSILTGASSTITVTVRNASGGPVANTSVTLSSTGSGNTIEPASATSNANGVATFTFSSTVAERKTITAEAGGVTLADTEVITVLAHSSTTEITGIAPEPSSSGQVFRVTVSVTGEGGGTPMGTVAIFSLLEQGGCDAAAINADGVATCDFALSVVDTHSINAVYSGDDQFEDSSDAQDHEVVAAAAVDQRASR